MFVRVQRTVRAVSTAKIIPHIGFEMWKLSRESAAELTCVMLPMTKDAHRQTAEKIKAILSEPKTELR